MDGYQVASILGWCAAINYSILLVWALLFLGCHDSIYRLHSKWFALSPEQFDRLNYLCLGIFKILVLVFNLTPYIALKIVLP